MRIARLVFFALILFSGLAADSYAWGKKVVLCVYFERGADENISRRDRKTNAQIGSYLEKDMIPRIRDAGFKAYRLKNPDDYSENERTYLLYIRVKSYERGGKPAFSLLVRYELSMDGKTPIIQDDVEISSRKTWKKCVEKINKIIVKTLAKNKKKLLSGEFESLEKETRGNEEDDRDEDQREEPSSADSVKGTPEERMKQLTELYERGFINYDEYTRKKDEILSGL